MTVHFFLYQLVLYQRLPFLWFKISSWIMHALTIRTNVFSFFSLLVHKGVFCEVYINFLIVGHTYEDIDAMFGR
jgi:hypothetical protein